MPVTDLLTVVIPVFGNAGTVEALHDQVVDAVAGLPCELLFVVDASPDDSLDRLLALQKRSSVVTVVSLSENCGQSWAILVGLAYGSGNVMATMDADLQDPPSALPSLLAAMDGEVDVVFAGRRGTYESRTRLLTSRLFKRMLTRATGGRIPPDAGLFLLLRREVADSLLSARDERPYLLTMLAREAWRVRSVPVEREASPNRRSGYTFLERLAVGRHAIRGAIHPPRLDARAIRSRIATDPHLRHVVHAANGALS